VLKQRRNEIQNIIRKNPEKKHFCFSFQLSFNKKKLNYFVTIKCVSWAFNRLMYFRQGIHPAPLCSGEAHGARIRLAGF